MYILILKNTQIRYQLLEESFQFLNKKFIRTLLLLKKLIYNQTNETLIKTLSPYLSFV